jgi:hypothetical protein
MTFRFVAQCKDQYLSSQLLTPSPYFKHTSSVHILLPYFCEIRFNIILLFIPFSCKWSPITYLTKILCAFLVYHVQYVVKSKQFQGVLCAHFSCVTHILLGLNLS